MQGIKTKTLNQKAIHIRSTQYIFKADQLLAQGKFHCRNMCVDSKTCGIN